ncbi:unnamed protein product [Echinostoma caproni]|uniref:Ca2+-activated K+ channel Slowpoke-like C-terminal domain-containing protein n=1 Tax=Echinostoma caproni TaxID=27848 RepID=A0A3P8GXW0_9TREM|nr:unnamed protein product [Echinostoma caproni]
MAFIETVLLGGPSHEVEKVFAEDSGFFPGLRGQTVTSIPFPGFEFKPNSQPTAGRNNKGRTEPQPDHHQQQQQQPSPQRPVFRVDVETNQPLSSVDSLSVNHHSSSQDSVLKMTSSSPNLHENFGSATGKTVRYDLNAKTLNPVPLMRFISLNDDSTNSAEWPSTSVNFTCLRRQLTDAHLNVEHQPRISRLKYSNVRNWRPLSTNSFLSYNTESGSVKVHLSRVRLLSLSALGTQVNQLIHQDEMTLTFGEMFVTVLQETGTICVGLYRRVEDLTDEEEQCDREHADGSLKDLGAQIARYVYTFPDSNTRIFPDDQVYCFTAVTEKHEVEW